ncbi:tRNA1(Val) (adenine(37)-N6)-methyltransferase [bioreactor metagenome]|uniref:tRNA1(Val) (Adenine(37)-N6)-methyltransferase n=1 Tax=bioreactor metagenome TaxID=1076179 RepID=A0A645GS24_9ZZZZ
MNPPYFSENSGCKSPDQSALIARHEVACNLTDISKCAAYLLKHSGRFCLCHRPERLCDIFEALRKYKLEPKRLRPVVQKDYQEPWLMLIEATKGGKPGLKIERQLIIKNQNNTYTDEFRSLYREFATF